MRSGTKLTDLNENPEGEVRVDLEDGLQKNIKIGVSTRKKKEERMSKETRKANIYLTYIILRSKKREKLDKQFDRFLKVIKHMHVSLPFTDTFSNTNICQVYELNFIKQVKSERDISG